MKLRSKKQQVDTPLPGLYITTDWLLPKLSKTVCPASFQRIFNTGEAKKTKIIYCKSINNKY